MKIASRQKRRFSLILPCEHADVPRVRERPGPSREVDAGIERGVPASDGEHHASRYSPVPGVWVGAAATVKIASRQKRRFGLILPCEHADFPRAGSDPGRLERWTLAVSVVALLVKANTKRVDTAQSRGFRPVWTWSPAP